MIERSVSSFVLKLAKQYPVITITGPRQSGKTTLCQELFPKHRYVSLENPNERDYANNNPKEFLLQSKKMIIDEIQKVPTLVSYIQGIVDESKRDGQYILTGSHQFELTSIISQSLAGRTAIVKLLPFSIEELKKIRSIDEMIYKGFYPRIFDKKLNPTQAMDFYINTYLEKRLMESS